MFNLFRNLIVFFCLVFNLTALVAGEDLSAIHKNNTVRFTENKNQWDSNILYCAQLDGGALFLEKNCFTYSFYDKESLRNIHNPKASNNLKSLKPIINTSIKSHAFRTTFLNASKSVMAVSKTPTTDYCNYFIGNDNKKWVGNVKNFKEVNYLKIYEGINLQVLGMQNSIKYNFYVTPHSNPNQIELHYEGLEKIRLEDGVLKLTTSINEIVEQRPYAYQWKGSKRVDVPCEFLLKDSVVSFVFPKGYDKAHELVIDPVMIFAASSGSAADNFGHTATYDEQGNLYSGGIAYGPNYPVRLGAFDETYNGVVQRGRTDVVITKYDASGSFLQYSTYLGGAINTEIVTSIIVDAQNNLYMYGVTGSSDFPVTVNAFDKSFNGGINYNPHNTNGNIFTSGTDIYVAKLSSDGSSLLSSTFIGGSDNDGINRNNTNRAFQTDYTLDSLQYNYGDYYRGEIDLDKNGNVIVATSTRSADFPIVNGIDNTLDGLQDAIVFKMDNTLSTLLWSTFLGGNAKDCANGLVIDNNSNIYVTGGTCSSDFPVSAGAHQVIYNGGKTDGYVVIINSTGTSILSGTFIGTNKYDQSYFVQLDKANNVYVFGQTDGAMPVTAGVYTNPNSGQFISKYNNALNTKIFTTVFGNGNGKPNIAPTAFLVDYCENLYVSGWANGFNKDWAQVTGMPITTDANDSTSDGADFYLMSLSKDALTLNYATYFGGDLSAEHVHGGTSRYDKKGIVYQSLCTGCGGNDDYPGTPGAWPNRGPDWNGANCNNAVFKMDFQPSLVIAGLTVDKLSGCAPLTVNFQNQSANANSFKWDFGGNDTISNLQSLTRTYTTPGTYTVQVYAKNPLTCNVTDTLRQIVTVHPAFVSDFDYVSQPCSNQLSFYDSSKTAPISWLWHFDDGDSSVVQNPQHSFDSIGLFNVRLISSNIYGCKDTAVVQVANNSAPVSITQSTNVCRMDSVQLVATGGIAYEWNPAAGLSSTTIYNPIAILDTSTTYVVKVTSINALGDTCYRSLSTSLNVISPTLFSLSAYADKDSIFKGDSTTLHAVTDTINVVTWNSSDGSFTSNEFNPVVTPQKTTTYTVSIIGDQACVFSEVVKVFVMSKECNPANVYVPNTFTPNEDGKNDVLFVRGNEITDLYFTVYNRWGQMVFETKDITKGWNGMYNGMKADPAVFAWYVKAKCYNGEDIEKKGNVTVIR